MGEMGYFWAPNQPFFQIYDYGFWKLHLMTGIKKCAKVTV